MQGELLRVDQSRSPQEDQRYSTERLRPERLRTDCPVLLSERLVMRAPHEEDIDALAHLANNAKVATMVSRMPHPYTAD
ncbi:N-acetyltransferase, partial [Rhizobium johnstonii]